MLESKFTNKNKAQSKINVTFRQSDFETELYNYAMDQSQTEVGGLSGYIKRLIAEDKRKKEGN